MKKYFFKIAAAAIFAATIVTTFLLTQKEKPGGIVKEAAASARRGMDWLLKYDDDLNDPGILWAVNEINKNYCGSVPVKSRGDHGASPAKSQNGNTANELGRFVSEKFKEFENHPVEAAYKKLVSPSADSAKPSAETIKTFGNKYDAELLGALYCEEEPDEEWQKILENQAFSELSGYDLTHLFLALLMAKENGCLAAEKIQPRMEASAAQIANEENLSKFGDLFAERAALLLRAGYKNEIKKEWIKKIIEKQNKSGSWNNSVLFGMPDDPHTTALATWALAQYSESCPIN